MTIDLVKELFRNDRIVRYSDLKEATHIFGQLHSIERFETPSLINYLFESIDKDWIIMLVADLFS